VTGWGGLLWHNVPIKFYENTLTGSRKHIHKHDESRLEKDQELHNVDMIL